MTDHDPHREGPTRPPGDCVSVLLIADPGKPADLADHLADHLPRRLSERGSPPRRWTTTVRRQPLVSDEHASLTDVIDAVDTDSDSDHEDIVVYLTDLPRRDNTVPVIGEVSADHKFALISIAAVGGIDLARRVTTVVELALARILGEPELAPTSAAKRFPSEQHENSTLYLAPKGLRRLRLLSGMVRANRPWRLVTGLSKVLVGAFATGAFALSTSTIWWFADTMGGWRLCAATILSTVALILWLVIDHELWERPESDEERERSRLYNTATLITLTIGVIVLHIALFGLLLFTAWLSLRAHVLSSTLGHGATVADYLELSWLLASIATIGGALGSGLEDDDAVKGAAYGTRQRQRHDNTQKE
ncbi:membrane protein [Rhodococcus sp. UNC23MFCrub1.1]|uniref:membrane protein n=1 Tax=Rhodococcus sp. UNC23MFCrub1.1 TaxID=1449068 RepID=UPI000487BD4B|nr:membrane protein [Rhodococcus sp. UNC23MFCrub1.1]